MKKLFDTTENQEKEKLKKLEEVQKFLEDMEGKSVELASKTDKLDSSFSIVNSHLSEPINCNTSKEAEELQHEVDDIKKHMMVLQNQVWMKLHNWKKQSKIWEVIHHNSQIFQHQD